MLGNERTLTNNESIWRDLIRDAKRRDCFFAAEEDSDVSKTILDVKKELDQLDDLLNPDSMLFKQGKWKVFQKKIVNAILSVFSPFLFSFCHPKCVVMFMYFTGFVQ